MRTLVLGGNGFIGSHLVDRLLSDGHYVRVFDRIMERYRAPIKGVDYRIGEFGNQGFLEESLEGIDVVFHLINSTLPKTSNDDPVFDVQTNVIESLCLLKLCVSNKVLRIVYLSSGGTVYGIPERMPTDENSSTNPLCSYGITKLTVEKYLFLFHQLHGLDYRIIRPSNPYGVRQNPNGMQGAIAVFLDKILRAELIEIWGDGSIVRDYLYVDDLVDGITKAAMINTNFRVFNIGSGIGYSLNGLIGTIRSVLGITFPVEYLKRRSFDVPKIYLDNSRARQQLNWKPTISLETGVKITWDFLSNL